MEKEAEADGCAGGAWTSESQSNIEGPSRSDRIPHPLDWLVVVTSAPVWQRERCHATVSGGQGEDQRRDTGALAACLAASSSSIRMHGYMLLSGCTAVAEIDGYCRVAVILVAGDHAAVRGTDGAGGHACSAPSWA
ncbi:hypothetical protein ACP70R_045762 [Stipagrostis hirtigluma subsp. patula]